MPEATIFMHDEGRDPVLVDLSEDSGFGEDGEKYPLSELLRDATGLHAERASIVSEWALLAACWALQQIAGGADPQATAAAALNEIALGGDLEDHTELVDEERATFTIAPLKRVAHEHLLTGTYEWEADGA